LARIHNFSAGPAALPEVVLQQVRDELLEWRGVGASVMEISHRDKAFIAIAEQAEADVRELLAVPANYKVLFLQGGATQQFALIPMNLAAQGQAADYLITGQWSQKAAKEAAKLVQVQIAASTEASNFSTLPAATDLKLDSNAAYVHYCPNETIHGVEFSDIPDTGSVPLIADMSSNFMSQPLDVSKFGMIYGGAQKNIGPSGITLLIVREDLLARQSRQLPNILNYLKHAEAASMLNTPPTFAWYAAGLVFQWMKQQGGLAGIGARNAQKAATLYDYIGSSGFYRLHAAADARSRMNVVFFLPKPELDSAFLKGAEAAGLMGLKGHRDLGGMRASIYNAVSQASVDVLVSYMKDFAARNG
jgi:phosphoserine aminotransferase